MIIDDVNNLGGFAFEKFVNSKIIAEGLKKGMTLNIEPEMLTTPWIDATISNSKTGEIKCVPYKNTTKVDNAYNQWKTTHSIPGRNLDRADALTMFKSLFPRVPLKMLPDKIGVQ